MQQQKKRAPKNGSPLFIPMNNCSLKDQPSYGFFRKDRIRHPITEPTSRATAYIAGFLMIAMTQKPPCGAGLAQPNAAEIAPAIAEPMIQDGITRPGSAAAYGIAPSEMKDRPMM